MDADTNKIMEREQTFARTAQKNRKYDREDLGELVERKYNESLKEAGAKLWRGTLQVGASGFGKGLLITAGLVLAVTAVIFGFGASMGEIMVNSQTATIGEGITIGLSKGLQFLADPAGWVFLAGGGTVGALADINKMQGRLSVADAERKAMQDEIIRQQERALEVKSAQHSMQRDEIPADGHVAEQVKRRARPQNMNEQLQPV